MKFPVLCLSAMLVLGVNVTAQIGPSQNQTATFEDGTKIVYNVVENVGDNQLPNTIAGFNMTDDRSIGCYSLMYARLNPERFYAYGEMGLIPGAGFGGITVGGTYFLAASEKNYELPISIRSVSSGSTQTKYVIKTPAVKNRHFGVNVEVGFRKYGVGLQQVNVGSNSYTLTSLSSGFVAIGGGYLTTKNATVKVDGSSFMGGSHLFHLTADALLFPGGSFEYSTSDSASAATPLTIKDVKNGGVGFRVMLQSQTSFKYNKKSAPTSNFGFLVRLGVMKSPYTQAAGFAFGDGICLVAGLGIFATF
jgi:hypothetical protein